MCAQLPLRIALTVLLGAGAACAQAPRTIRTLGSVASADASVTTTAGSRIEVAGGRALLVGNPTVTAGPDRTATVALNAGGEIRVCRTTGLHLSETSTATPLLLLSLDRGAIEIKRKAIAGDSLMTPDLRFTMAGPGNLDLRVRVVFSGDTCVENRGRRAPVIEVTDAFGEASYQLKPGQHVTFEGGSLRAMVDREDVPCGCPPEEKPGMSMADAMLSGKPKPGTAANPFPAAQSEGLAPPPAGQPEKPGETHMEIATTLSYDPAAAPATVAPPPAIASQAPIPPPVATASSGVPLSAIGHFFKRLFVR